MVAEGSEQRPRWAFGVCGSRGDAVGWRALVSTWGRSAQLRQGTYVVQGGSVGVRPWPSGG